MLSRSQRRIHTIPKHRHYNAQPLSGCRLTTVAPERLCEVCGFIEAAPFQLPSAAEQAALHTDAVVELEELVISGVREAPAWTEALKNLVFFFVATGQQGGGALEGGRQKEPWVQRLVAKALEEVEHRHHNALNAQPLKFVA